MTSTKRLIFSGFFVLAFLTDQISKYLIVEKFGTDEGLVWPVIAPYLNFTLLHNYGINFGLFDGAGAAQRWILVLITGAIALYVAFWAARSEQRMTWVSAGLLVGGALGNIVDRIRVGYVIDFINNSLPNQTNPFAYNVADIWIFAGVVGLVIWGNK